MKIVELPRTGGGGSIGDALRALAEQMDRGDHGKVNMLAWVARTTVPDGSPGTGVGMIAPLIPDSPGTTHMLFALGMKHLEADLLQGKS
jgi:hypothetical protein